MNKETTIGPRLRELRISKGLSQADVAKSLGVQRTTYVNYEAGFSRPVRKLKELAALFNVSTDYILGNTNIKNPAPVPQQTISGEDLLKKICENNPKALEVLDRMKITSSGEINITGIDLDSKAVIKHLLGQLVGAMEGATIDNGHAHITFTPDFTTAGGKQE